MYEIWNRLTREIDQCQNCGLARTRINVVPGEGNIYADVMFIGEGPGAQEDLFGRPFVGPAGQLLTRMIESIGLRRSDVYIANIVKCRPPNNRQPEPDEALACSPFLKRQIELVRPRIIVLLGATAARNIISPSIRITKDRGTWYERKGISLLVTYHPSALLRNDALKKDAWLDMQSLRARLDELHKE